MNLQWLDSLQQWLRTPQAGNWILFSGFVALFIALAIATRTQWGQSEPLRKCVFLSLLVHVFLAGLATTVRIVSGTHLAEPVRIRVASLDELPERDDGQSAAPETQPWDQPADSPLAPRTEPLDRVNPELPSPQAPLAENDLLAGRLPLRRDDPFRIPDPQSPEVPQQSPEVAGAEPTEPVETIAPQRRDAPETRPPLESLPQQAADEPPLAPVSVPPVRSVLLPDLKPRLPEMAEEPVLRETPGPAPSAEDLAGTPTPQNPAEPAAATRIPQDTIPARAGDASNNTQPAPADAPQVSAEVPRPSEGPLAGSPGPGRDKPAPLLQLRTAPNRQQVAAEHGATPASEAAVRAALQWLAANQGPDGSWNPARFEAGQERRVLGQDRQGTGADADTGISGLALLAFLGAGQTHLQGTHRQTVQRGLEYLLRVQASDGNLAGRARAYAFMYCHAMAGLALSEAYAMTGDQRLRPAVQRAVAYTLHCQHPTTGGWRYRRGDLGDTSQLGWQLMLLKSAESAGIEVPTAALEGAIRYLKSVSSGTYGGLAAYRPSEPSSRPMTAEALFCKQLLGMSRQNPASDEAGDFLLGELPGTEAAANFYYWYYGTLAMFQLGGPHWQRWNAALQDNLIGSQVQHGADAGSWHPRTVWGGYGGRVYTTAMGALCLEVYYRYLPLYGGEPVADDQRK